METYAGKTIFQGIAIGPLSVYRKKARQVSRIRVTDSKKEWERYLKAREQAAAELRALYEKAVCEVGKVNAAIFEVQSMMLEDDDYNDSVQNMIKTQQVNAEYAAAVTGDNFSEIFAGMQDEYFRARAADIKDISERILSALSGRPEQESDRRLPSIIAAVDLAPSETVQMEKDKLLGFVTEQGSSNSHTAILARTMNLPALIGIQIKEEWDGRMAVIDGWNGILYIDPDEETLGQMQRRQEQDRENAGLLRQLKGKKTITGDGKEIRLYANVGSISDIAGALENDAEGIGLFRSEFLYLERDRLPSEEEQFSCYRQAVQMMAGKKVIIRTMDIGADKRADYLNMQQEENPAMGYRAIRICLKETDIFKTQLRALLRAAVYGNLSIMYPMITSVEEVEQISAVVKEVQRDLEEAQIPCRVPEQGIMIETPAAVMICDDLAPLVDFFCIGTNDLTQYTLAVDRQNAKLEDFYKPHHKAILRMIEMTVKEAHRSGKWVGICGELGADLSLTEEFIRIGVDELSVAPAMILKLRKKIRETRA